jgi:hypothetical protein
MGVGLSLGGFEYQYGHNNVADHIADLAALSHQRIGNSETGMELTCESRIIPTRIGIKQVRFVAWEGSFCNSL